MHRKFHDVPDALCRTDITGADMIKYLVDIFTDTDSGTIMTFVYVLVNVLDGLDGGADLNVDMTTISDRQKGVVGNDVTVVKGMTFGVGIGFTIIWPGILRITIFTIAGLGVKILWIMLAAFTVDHARSVSVFRTAGTMHHALCDDLIEHGMSNRVRDLTRHDRIHMGSITDLKGTFQKEQEMDVRQATLLKLYGEDIAEYLAKQIILYIFKHGLDLLSKDTCDNGPKTTCCPLWRPKH